MSGERVFISYNSKDKAAVERIVTLLKRHDVPVWYDDQQLGPGSEIREGIQGGLVQATACICFISPVGLGPYQKAELDVAGSRQVKKQMKLIIAFLPGDTSTLEEELIYYTSRLGYVRFHVPEDERALGSIYKELTGRDLRARRAPRPRAIDVADRKNAIAEAASELVVAYNRYGSLTFFLGSRPFGFVEDEQILGLPPRQCDIARDLLEHLGVRAAKKLKVLPTVDNVGTYYAAGKGTIVLEERVTNKYVDTRPMSELHEQLAAVLKRFLSQREETRLQTALEPQLIVTTSLDVMIERALLRAEIPFTRIVQHGSAPEIIINEYRTVKMRGGDLFIAGPDDPAPTLGFEKGNFKKLDFHIANVGRRVVTRAGADDAPLRDLSLIGRTAPFLYKYHGSLDIPGSCALTTEHYMRLAIKPAVPSRILEIIGNSAAAFLGSGLLDSDALHAYDTLLRRGFELKNRALPRIAVVERPRPESKDPYVALEATVWPKVREAVMKDRSITMVEGEGTALLREMLARMTALPREGAVS